MGALDRTGLAERVAGYVAGVNTKMELNDAKYESIKFNTHCEVDYGPRYIRVRAKDDCGAHSVHSFIDRTNGDIVKAANFKAPDRAGKTKGVRGNVFAEDFGLSCVNYCMTNYLK